ELRGTVLDVRWSDTEDPAPAELLSIGEPRSLERKRAKLASAAAITGSPVAAEPESTVAASREDVDIGGGVLVENQVVAQLTSGCSAGPGKFARALLRHVFSEEELAGHSLFGGKHAKGAREALDPTRVNAVIGKYTICITLYSHISNLNSQLATCH
ncbi:hypothetical protein MTO96_045121, partial [Rhipicephalus appendiculatus]